MVNFDKRPLDHADDRLRSHEHPRRLPEHRYASTGWILLAAFAALVIGIATKQAAVVAVGVVLAAAGGSLYERRRQRTRGPD